MEQENTTRKEERFHNGMGNPEEEENMGQGNTTTEEGFHIGTGNPEEENMEQENTTTEEEWYRNTRQENSTKERDENSIESFEKRKEDEGYEKEHLRIGSIRKSYFKLLEE